MLSKTTRTRLKRAFVKTKKALQFIENIGEKLPRQSDTTFRKITRVSGLLNTVFFPAKKSAGFCELAAEAGLVLVPSARFLSIFLDSPYVREACKVNEIDVSDDFGSGKIVELENAALGKVLFAPAIQGLPGSFYAEEDFDIDRALDFIWSSFEGFIHTTVKVERWRCSKGHVIGNPLYGRDEARMARLISEHRACEVKGTSPTYMFYGLPGTGKTSFAFQFASRVGGRTLTFDSSGFSQLTLEDVMELLTCLRPDFVILDDFDKVDNTHGITTMLEVFQEVQHQGTSFILTSNEVDDFDMGLFRPGRIRTWEEFTVPDESERREVLQGYMKASGVLAEPYIETLVKETEGLTQDYLREVVDRLQSADFSAVLAWLTHIRALLAKVSDSD